jgi:hypothetical protein
VTKSKPVGLNGLDRTRGWMRFRHPDPKQSVLVLTDVSSPLLRKEAHQLLLTSSFSGLKKTSGQSREFVLDYARGAKVWK